VQVKNHRLHQDTGAAVDFESTPNRRGTLAGGQPKYIVMHFTASGSARGSIDWLSRPQAKASAHLVIGPDGVVTQMVDLNETALHAGRSSWKGLNGLNSHSVGIEMVNWGGLLGGRGGWRSWTGAPVKDARVIEAEHKNKLGQKRGWEIFDPAQIDAAANAVAAIADAYGIGARAVIGHDDIAPHRKDDPGPAWDMESFRALVFGNAEDEGDIDLFEVSATAGLNLRDGTGVGAPVKELLPRGTQVVVIERNGSWWLVSKMKDGQPDTTGWVHSRWLAEV
jgi:N-acetylmuramoyl-L-alanine amidase